MSGVGNGKGEWTMELTILMPCLNEAETIGICVEKAMTFLNENHIVGEVLVADNGSTDGSGELAKKRGARVIYVAEKGYGSALIAGTKAAYGTYVIMGDADDSYDFINLMPFVEKLREGYELVMGNRFKGGIEKGAMPPLHRYLGNPVLSFIGRMFYQSSIGDFHCGLRGYRRESILALGLQTTGMEYASEMVVMSELASLKIAEVPTTLSKDGRSHPPHLKSFRDGWRHLKFLFMYSPDWLFLYPGIFLTVVGVLGGLILTFTELTVGKIVFSIHTLLYCMLFVMVGVNILYFYIFTKLYAEKNHFIPNNKNIDIILKISVDKGIFLGIFMILSGIVLSVWAVVFWGGNDFQELIPSQMMRIVIPAVTLIEVGIENIFAGFFIGILKIRTVGGNDGKGN